MLEPLTDDDPRTVGPFRLDGRLGTGAMGRVYLGRTDDGQPAAIKVVRAELADDAEFRRRFQKEVEAIDRVRGGHTAALVDSDLDAAQPWLATEYLPGPSLRTVVHERGPLPADEVLRIADGIAQALEAIHAAGIVHRDLKPGNVLLLPDGPRVIDFGISRAADGTVLTATGITPGTPSYISPEQIRGEPAGPAADVFALGVLMTFLATGETPFGEDNASAVLYRIMHSPPRLDGVTGRLRELITVCLDRNPDGRPTPAQLAQQCRDWSDPDTASSTARAAGVLSRHRRRVLAALGVVVLLCAGLVTAALVRESSTGGSPVAAGAQPSTNPPKPTCTGAPTVQASGSALFNDVMIRAASAYQRACPGHSVAYEQTGSGDAFGQFGGGAVDLVATDYPLTEQDDLDAAAARCFAADPPLLQVPMIFYPIAITYHLPGVDRLILDAPTIAGIFSGQITNWNDPTITTLNSGVKLPDLPIEVLFHRDPTIVTKALQQYLAAAGLWSTDAGVEFTGGVGTGQSEADLLRVVGQTPGAIGYVAQSAVLRTNTPIAEIVNSDGAAVELSTSTVRATMDAVARNDALVLDPETIYRVGGKAYPLVTVGYHVVCTRYPEPPTALAVKDLLNVATSIEEPAASVDQRGYLLPMGALAQRIRTAVQDIY